MLKRIEDNCNSKDIKADADATYKASAVRELEEEATETCLNVQLVDSVKTVMKEFRAILTNRCKVHMVYSAKPRRC